MSREIELRDADRGGWLESLKDRVGRVFDRWLARRRDTDGQPLQVPEGRLPAVFGALGPAVDVIDEGDSLRVIVELPGLSADDFKVELSGNRLYLTGEKKTQRQDHSRGWNVSECSHGSFSRIIPLPCEVENGSAKASFKNGQMELTVSKSESARARRVRVTVS
jgi:HSP20 family protein